MDDNPSATNQQPSEEDNKPSLVRFCWDRYKDCPNSVAVKALIAGLFFTHLLDDDELCNDRMFTRFMFYLSVLHLVIETSTGLLAYSEKVANMHGERSTIEDAIPMFFKILRHFLRLLQYPILCGMTYYVIKFMHEERNGTLYHERDLFDECLERQNGDPMVIDCDYCQRSTVSLARFTVFSQLVYGVMVLGTWYVGWKVSIVKGKARRPRRTKMMNSRIMETIFALVEIPLFDSDICDAMMSLSIAATPYTCKFINLNWFLTVCFCNILNTFLSDMRTRMETISKEDGSISQLEQWILDSLQLLHFPLFLVEVAALFYINVIFWAEFENVQHVDENADSYCSEGTWNVTSFIVGMYSCLLVFKIIVVCGTLSKGKPITPKDSNPEALEIQV